MAQASGSAAEGEASGAAMTSGSGGGFELNSVTPSAVKNTIGVTAGGIFGSNFPRAPFELTPMLAALGIALLASVTALVLVRRKAS